MSLIHLDPIKEAVYLLIWCNYRDIHHLLVVCILVLLLFDQIPCLFARVHLRIRVLLSELDHFIVDPLLLLEDADDLIAVCQIYVQ